jgi:hypothetical protein
MLNLWFSFGLKAWQIGLEAQSVIALRMLRLAAGGARAEAEASRMVTEKVMAAGEAQMAAAMAAMGGDKEHVIAAKALNVYGKRVRANRRRLSR